MNKFIYFDASSGVSGDMILGAFLDLGADPDRFRKDMAKLRLPVRIDIGETERSHLRGLKVDVHVDREKHVTRTLADIEEIINRAALSEKVKDNSRKIFRRLFVAEAKVHGCPIKTAHLHEAGADDALIDVVGACRLAEMLGIDEFFCSPLNVGEGFVKTSHGLLSVPPPAVAELLKGIPVYSAGVKEELVTPTGAAIVSTLVRKFISLPEITYEKIGCGAGSRDTHGLPNILRAFLGETGRFNPGKNVFVIEATMDDASPQVLARFMDRAMELGALDAFLSPIVMKKGRLASKLTLVSEADKMDRLIEAVFRETSSIGVRYHAVERRVLEREFRKVTVREEDIRIKICTLGGEIVNIQPEYEDCVKAAGKTGLPLKEVLRTAAHSLEGKQGKRKPR